MNPIVAIIFVIYFIIIGTAHQLCDQLTNGTLTQVSDKCLTQLHLLCVNTPLLWQILDASSKYPHTGLSYSNNRDLGNYDECITADGGDVKGKFCGMNVVVVNTLLPDQPMSLLSLCIPDQCSVEEVGEFFLSDVDSEGLLVNFVETTPCVTKESFTTLDAGDIVFTVFLCMILLSIIWCTIYELIMVKFKREPLHPILLSFSLITNGKRLFHISSRKNSDQFHCLNGLRFISMMWVVALHSYGTFQSVPLINYAEVHKYIDNAAVQYLASGYMSVDTFFFMTGFLFSYSFIKSSAKNSVKEQVRGIPMMIVHRYLRITPALAVLYLGFITIFKLMGDGPLWGSVSTILVDGCKRHWWQFFLYLQNYVNYSEVCLEHTWYLSADMQMYILAPLVLIPVAYFVHNGKTIWAVYGLVGLISICVIIPMIVRFVDDSITNGYDAHSRFNEFIIGILLGVIMREYPKFPRFPSINLVNIILWCFFLALVAFLVFFKHFIDRQNSRVATTFFDGLYRPLWCISIAWMVYSCHHGYGGPVNWFLSHPMFQIGARLSYCMYLIHMIVIYYWTATLRTTQVWSTYSLFYVWSGHFLVTLIISIIWTLSFESPMIIIEKCIFGGKRKRPQKQKQLEQNQV